MNEPTQTQPRARCDACKFYAKVEEMQGQCRCNPPSVKPGGHKADFPMVAKNMWCGQFEPGTPPSEWTKNAPETPGHAIKQARELAQPGKGRPVMVDAIAKHDAHGRRL